MVSQGGSTPYIKEWLSLIFSACLHSWNPTWCNQSLLPIYKYANASWVDATNEFNTMKYEYTVPILMLHIEQHHTPHIIQEVRNIVTRH